MAKVGKIGSRIELEGQREYKAACKDITDNLRLLGSQMKLVTAEFGAGDKSIDGLTRKQDVLQKQLAEQSKAAEAAESALAKMRQEGVEPTAPAFKDMERVLIDTKTEIFNTQRALDKTGDELDEATKAGQRFGDGVADTGKAAKEAGNDFSKLAEIAGGMAKALATGLASITVAAGALAVKLGTEVVNAFGELEQNLGGSEAVFGEYADSIQKSGEEAYKNLGVSQSEYLATANKMGALFQGSGIEQQKSLELTEQAMQRAADMASVMGIDMQVALDSVAGAAKGNYTMMDNLGVAMNDTAIKAYAAEKGIIQLTEAERAFANVDINLAEFGLGAYSIDEMRDSYNKLVKDAQEGSGDIRIAAQDALHSVGISFLDLQQTDPSKLFNKFVDGAEKAADKIGNTKLELSVSEKSELAMQMFFDKTEQYAGNFAKESTQTISGSIGLLQASVSSFVAGLGNSEADIANLTGNIAEAFGAVVSNITPIIQNITQALPQALLAAVGEVTKLAPELIDTAMGLFDGVLAVVADALPVVVELGVSILESVVEGVVNSVPELATAAIGIVQSLVDGVITMLPLLINGAMQLIVALAQGIGAALPQLIPKIVEMLTLVVKTLIDNIPLLIEAALQLVAGLAQGLIAAIPVLIGAIPEIIDGIITAIFESIPLIIQSGIDLLTSLVEALPEIITSIVEALPQIIQSIIFTLLQYTTMMIQAGVDLMTALITNLPLIITTIVMSLPEIIMAIVEGLLGNIPALIEGGVTLFTSLIGGLPRIIAGVVVAIPEIITSIVDSFMEKIEDIKEVGVNLISGIWEGIQSAGSWLKDQITGFFGDVVGGIKEFLGIHSPSTVFAEIGDNMAAGIGIGFGDEMGGVGDDMQAAVGGAGSITAREAIDAINNGILGNIALLDQSVKAIVERVLNGLTAQNAAFTKQGIAIAESTAAGMLSGITHITNTVPEIVTSILNAFVAKHSDFTKEGIEIDKSTATGMIRGIPQITSKVPQIMQSIITTIRNSLSSFVDTGMELARGLWSGFESQRGWLLSSMQDMMQEIVQAARSEMQIASPSKVFAQIGKFMAEGMNVGFADEMRTVTRSIRDAMPHSDDIITDEPRRTPQGGIKRTDGGERGGKGGLTVVQKFYTEGNDYAKQQREAAKQFRQIARAIT